MILSKMNTLYRHSAIRTRSILVLLSCSKNYHPLSHPSTSHVLGQNKLPICVHVRNFKDFYRESYKLPQRYIWIYVFIFLGFLNEGLNWPRIKYVLSQKMGLTEESTEADADVEILNQDFTEEPKTEEPENDERKKEKLSFRDKKIIQYENRIRHFSTPDKVFRYFATLQVAHVHEGQETHEVFMTPDDFLRSITPGIKQPEGLGLDTFIKYDPKNVHMKLELALNEDSIFFKLGSSGLISFSDFIFLLTVLSTSKRHFEIAFRMFDLNGDGDVDVEEFEKVASLIQQQTSIGTRHRDHRTTGSTFKGVNSALTTYFFGTKRNKKLTIEKFLDFQKQLQREILILEFQRKDPDENGKITETDFTELLLAYAGYAPKKESRVIKRVKKKFKENSEGITSNDYLQFFHFLNNINDVDTALTFYHIASASIDQATLKHVAKTVAHVDLSDHVIEVVFTIFDENRDGQLSNKEFIAVMKNRLLRGLEKPKDMGFVRLFETVLKCGKELVFNSGYK